MKILISWLGYNEDFEGKGEGFIAKASGFTATIQRDIIKQYKIEKHYVLITYDSSNTIQRAIERKAKCLLSFIQSTYEGQHIETLQTNIDKKDLQNFHIIESSLRSLIQRFDESDQIYVVAGTGPTAVSIAWSTLSMAMNKRFGLYVMQRPEYNGKVNISSLIEIEPRIDQLLDDTLREQHFSNNLPATIYSDEIVELEYARAHSYAQATDMNILILGETGCGKDRMAEYIHQNSPLSKNTYKAINCASLQDEVLYSELFGHVKGSYTDATSDRIGLFQECIGGTLFLDEIGDISPFMQQSLLRAIENKQIKKLGSNDIIKDVNVRIIAATNNNLYEKCKEGKFRWDLYYRLSNPEILLKSYRERTADSRKKIITHYISILEKKWGRQLNITSQAMNIIEAYNFPGNFREIFNTLNSFFPLNSNEITVEDLPARFKISENQNDESYESALKNHCLNIYKKYNYDLTKTCKALGYANVTQLRKKLVGWGYDF